MHFEGGKNVSFPERLTFVDESEPEPAVTWESATVDDLISPEVRALLEGG
ncbi:MAG: hypothetical protein WBB07_02865 [Mycobacterium sp.]